MSVSDLAENKLLKYSKAVVYRMKTWGQEVVGDVDISFSFYYSI